MSGGCFLETSGRLPNPIRTDDASVPSPPAGGGMLTSFPSATPLGLALGTGEPWADLPSPGTLGLSATGSLTLFVATHVNILASECSTGPSQAGFIAKTNASEAPREALKRQGLNRQNAPLPRILRCILSFGSWLEPRYIFAAGPLI